MHYRRFNRWRWWNSVSSTGFLCHWSAFFGKLYFRNYFRHLQSYRKTRKSNQIRRTNKSQALDYIKRSFYSSNFLNSPPILRVCDAWCTHFDLSVLITFQKTFSNGMCKQTPCRIQIHQINSSRSQELSRCLSQFNTTLLVLISLPSSIWLCILWCSNSNSESDWEWIWAHSTSQTENPINR